MILGVVIYLATGNVAWVLFPLVVRAFGLIASMISLLSVRGREEENPMAALNRGYYLATTLCIVGLYIAVASMLDNNWLFGAGVVGILTSVAVVYITQYYTEPRFRPVKEIAQASKKLARQLILLSERL